MLLLPTRIEQSRHSIPSKHCLLLLYHAPAIRQVLAKEQRVGTEVFARVLEKTRDLGLCEPSEPILGYAYLIQSILVGRILVDLVDDPESDRQWEKATLETLRLILKPTKRA